MEKAIEVENKAYIPSHIKEIFNCARCDLQNKRSRHCKLLTQYGRHTSCPLSKTIHLTYKEAKEGI